MTTWTTLAPGETITVTPNGGNIVVNVEGNTFRATAITGDPFTVTRPVDSVSLLVDRTDIVFNQTGKRP